MRTQITTILVCLLTMISLTSKAQFYVHFTHYWALQSYYNLPLQEHQER